MLLPPSEDPSRSLAAHSTQHTLTSQCQCGSTTANQQQTNSVEPTLLPLLPRCRQRYQSGSLARLSRIASYRSKLHELSETTVTVSGFQMMLHEETSSVTSTGVTKKSLQDLKGCETKPRYLRTRRTSGHSTELPVMRVSLLRQRSRLCLRLADTWTSGQRWNLSYRHTDPVLSLSLEGKSSEACCC